MSRSSARRLLPLLVIFLGILVQTQASFALSERPPVTWPV